jgi:hypothetical protein
VSPSFSTPRKLALVALDPCLPNVFTNRHGITPANDSVYAFQPPFGFKLQQAIVRLAWRARLLSRGSLNRALAASPPITEHALSK